MCLIIDANVAHEVGATPPHADALPVIREVHARRLKIALGGQIVRELMGTSIRRWLVEQTRSGNTARYDDAEVTRRQETVRATGRCCSNDTHVIALALVSGARVLYSHDTDLHADFRNKDIIDAPRGSIYSSHSHEHLLRNAPQCRL
jgi:hypothetical protein